MPQNRVCARQPYWGGTIHSLDECTVARKPHKWIDGMRPAQSRQVLILMTLLLSFVAVSRSQASYSGGGGTRQDPYLIGKPQDLLTLAATPDHWAAHFQLTADIDMSDVPRDAVYMIGTAAIPFRGSFDGAGRRILHYTCICPGQNRVGLFGHIRALNGGVHDLCLIDPNVEAVTGISVGALVGHLGTGEVLRCRVEGGHVVGYSAVGGLVGWSYARVTGSTAQAEVHGQYSGGGLVGLCAWDAEVRDCVADANVIGVNRIGGLAGACTSATIEWSSTKGFAAGLSYIGGLIGVSEGATVMNCYSTTSAKGDAILGGLVGYNGLCFDDNGSYPGVIYNCYSTGLVTGRTGTGGLVAVAGPDCIVQGSFWDTQTSGAATSAGGTGLTTQCLQTAGTYTRAGWGFSQLADGADYWTILAEPQYPIFAWQISDKDLGVPTSSEP